MIKAYGIEFPNFRIEEFVPRSIYNRFGDNAIRFLDFRLLQTAQKIRNEFGVPMIINNWHSGGRLQNRGYRTPYSSVGATYSQHKMGRAIDFNILGMTSDEVYEYILEHEKKFRIMGITTMEDKQFTRSWTHIDLRVSNLLEKILIVTP